MQRALSQDEVSRLIATADNLATRLRDMEDVERAAVLLLTTQMLDIAARTWGRGIVDDPAQAPAGSLLAAHDALVQAWDETSRMLRWTGKTREGLRQLMATDMTLSTVVYPLAPNTRERVSSAWRLLWGARIRNGEGRARRRVWERRNGVDACPRKGDGERPDDGDVLATATAFPGFLRAGTGRTARGGRDG